MEASCLYGRASACQPAISYGIHVDNQSDSGGVLQTQGTHHVLSMKTDVNNT